MNYRYLLCCLLLPLGLLGGGLWSQVTANFNANILSGCSPLVVQFSDLSSGPVSTWNWNFGNGNTSNLQNPSAIFVNPGTYTITLTVGGGGGSNTITRTAYITVFQNPTANFNTSSPLTGCAPHTICFNNTSIPGTGAITNWLWDFGDGTTSFSQNPCHTYNNAGDYNVSLVVTDVNGCSNTFVRSNYVHVKSLPNPSFSCNPRSGCTAPLTVSFSNFTNGGTGPYSYQWSFGDGGTSTAATPSHTYTSPGSFTVRLIAIDANGCRDTVTYTNYITIGNITANFVPDRLGLCVGQSVLFTNTSTPSPMASYWSFGDGGISNLPNPSHTYNAAGTYTVRLVVWNGACYDTLIQPNLITVVPAPDAQFVADTTRSCEVPFTVNFTDNSPGNPNTWLWTFGDGSSSTLQNPSHTYTSPGSYHVTLHVTGPYGCTDSLRRTNYIRIVEPTASYTATPNMGCIPLFVQFQDFSTSVQPIVSWQWNFGDGSTSNLQNPSHVYTTVGLFDVSLIITNSWGCTDTLLIPGYCQAGTPPTPCFSFSPAVQCAGSPVNFTNCSTNANSYYWNWGSYGSSTLASPSYVFQDTGCFVTTFTAYNYGCPSTIVDTNEICILPPVSIFTTNPAIGCNAPLTVQFINNSIMADTYFWQFGDGGTSTLQAPSHTYNAVGTYTVALTVTNFQTGCSNTSTYNLVIRNPVANFVPNPAVGCAPLSVNFQNQSTAYQSLLWTFPNGDTSTATNPSYLFSNPGTQNVTLTVWDDIFCSDTYTFPVQVNGPAVNFTASQTSGCYSMLTQFNNLTTSQANITSYLWNFGDGSTSTLPNPSHLYQPGLFSVSLTVTDATGCSRTFTRPFYINVTAPVANFFPSDYHTCRGRPIMFFNTSTAGGNWQWNFGDGGISSLPNPTHSYSSNGVFTVSLSMQDANGCRDTIVRPLLIEIEDVLANFGANPTSFACPPGLVNFSDSSSYDISQWIWDFGDGSNAYVQNPSHLYTIPGQYNVTLTVINNDGCVDSVRMNGLVSLDGPYGTFSMDPDTGCTPLTVTFIANATNTASYTWDFGDGNVITTTIDTIVHVYGQGGVYYPTVILDNGLGCQYSIVSPDSIVVDTLPIPAFSASSFVQCGNSSIQFFDQSISNRPIVSWLWDFGDGNTSTLQNPSHSYATVGTYTITLSVVSSWGCSSSTSFPAVITVAEPPTAHFGITDTLNCRPWVIQLQDSSQGQVPIVAWQWTFGDGGSSSLQNPTHGYVNSGSYLITLIAIDSNGCRDTSSQNYVVPQRGLANFNALDAVGCQPLTVAFTATSNLINSYFWDFGDGQTSNVGPQVTHIYPNFGHYNVTLMVEDIYGCIDTLLRPAYVFVDSVDALFDVPTPIGCAPFLASFTDLSFSDTTLVAWQWQFGDGGTSSAQNPTHLYTQPGNYDVTLIVTSILGCTDTITLPAITVYNNEPPGMTPLLMVTVESNTSDSLSWLASRASDFDRYVIWWEQPLGSGLWVPLDSIYNIQDTTYTHSGLNTLDNSYCYKLQVVDFCGYRSDLDSSVVHCTINLEASPVVDNVDLSWNAYTGWNAVAQYELYRVSNYDTTQVQWLATLPGNVTQYRDAEVECYTDYCYRVVARELGGFGEQSWSDTSCGRPIHIVFPIPVEICAATVLHDSIVELSWGPSLAPDGLQFKLERSIDGQNWSHISYLPLNTTQFLDQDVNVHAQSYYYRIAVIDSCGDRGPNSNIGRTILLEAESNLGTPFLTWNPYQDWDNGVQDYGIEVFNDASQSWQLVTLQSTGSTTFLDAISNLSQLEYCYRILATESGGPCRSMSNVDCVPIGPNLFVPTGFTPNGDGLNDFFRAHGVYISDFHMRIYDRWGKLIFESFDIENTWSGKFQGLDCQEGVYVWTVDAIGYNGEVFEKRGTVTLVR